MWITRVTASWSTSASRIRWTTSRSADSPSSSDLVSNARTTAMTTSRMPMQRVPTPSQTPSPVITVSETPSSARTSPISAPVSSSRTTGSSGALARRTNSTQPRFPFAFSDSLMAVKKDQPSIKMAKTSTPTAQPQPRSSCGSWIFS